MPVLRVPQRLPRTAVRRCGAVRPLSAHFELGDVSARRAIDAPADGPLLAIVGPASSGKTESLARRYLALLARDTALTADRTIVTAADAAGAAALAARIAALRAPTAGETPAGRYMGVPLERLAFDLLAEHAALTGLAFDLERIDEYDAEEIFERATAPLFSADWADFLGPDIDPEIPGLRMPDRFAVAVLRLIRKLRDAQISPAAFLKAAQRGATAFYAAPPNLAAPALLSATKDEHRSALAVDDAELDRQRRRELDLAKIIAKLYASYLDELVAHGCLTATDALAEAIRLLEEHPAIARACRNRFAVALVDDVHDLRTAELRLLQAIFGPDLTGVTVAGDPDAATRTFAGARPERVFGLAAVTLRLPASFRVPPQLSAAATAVVHGTSALVPPGDALRLHRAASTADEAAFVAAAVVSHIARGTPPGRIAILHRSARTLGVYEDALLERNVPIALCGDAAIFARHETLDALAILWATADPFAHAWLLRVLQMPPLGFADATLALLCGEPAGAQQLLFDLPDAETPDGGRRWDRRRDLRLGTNVVRGDRDHELMPEARERLASFRERRQHWQDLARRDGIASAGAILLDAGLAVPRRGETAARRRRRADLTAALLAVLGRYALRHPGADLATALGYCERIARSDAGPDMPDPADDAVVVAPIDRVKDRRFDHVFVVDVRAGSFPPYYVPDAFLFSPTYGMIPKDSVGDSLTARTAKFTWYLHQAKLREAYAREDRRALGVALSRADCSATVSAAGRPTRGVAAPELLTELQERAPNATVPAAVPAPADPMMEPAFSSGVDAITDAALAARPAVANAVPPASRVVIAAAQVAEMLRCMRCAPRAVIARARDAGFTLLGGRAARRDRRIEARAVRFGYALGPAVVDGAAPGVVRHRDRLYVAVALHDPATAALAIHGLSAMVAGDAFFVETDDGTLSGPHTVDIEPYLAAASAVLDGSAQPLCAEHQPS